MRQLRTAQIAKRTIAIGAAAVTMVLGGYGCGTTPPQATKEEATSFKGGPMPPEARAKMEQAIANAKAQGQGNH